jgi:iron complex transport system substrate-binding protein
MSVHRRTLLSYALACLALPSQGRAQSANAVRLISVGGALTEIVYALGAQQSLVAVDTTSLFPEAATKLPKVGYMRSLSAEGVLALRPTAMLLTTEAGPPPVIAQLRAAGVRMEVAQSDHSFEEVRQKIRMVARITERETAGRDLEQRLSEQWATTQAKVRAQTVQPRVLFILSHAGAPQVSGAGTAADAMIQLSGGVNVMQGFNGYRPMTPEAMVAAAPQVILTTEQGLIAVGGEAKLLSMGGLPLTPAGKNKQVITVEALQLLGFGPRLPQTVADIAQRLLQAVR